VRFKAGQKIIEEGDAGDSLYIMSEGTATASKRDILDTDGTEKILMEYEKGEWFGELAMITSLPRKATVVAVSAVEVLQLPRDTFEAFVGRFDDVLQRNSLMYEQLNADLAHGNRAATADSGSEQGQPQSKAVAANGGRVPGSMQLLKELQALPGSDVCCDCGDPGPSWASSNTGALICLSCSGVHRLIGTEFSKVLSVKLDAWEASLLANMQKGNAAVNAELEAILGETHHSKPKAGAGSGADRTGLEAFIYSKYALRSFCEGGGGKLENLPSREGESRSTSNIGMVVMIGVVFTTIVSVTANGWKVDRIEGKIVGAPRSGATRNKVRCRTHPSMVSTVFLMH
jgi:hypothetical protein